MSEKALTVTQQREVTFYDDTITAAKADDGHVYAAVGNMCDALGIDTQAQTRRIRRQPVLEDGLTSLAILATQVQKGTEHDQQRQVYMLRVDLVPLWLSGINTRSIKDDAIRRKLERFQKEAAKVLWEAFQEGRLTAADTFDQLLSADTPAARTVKMLEAMLSLARQQLLLEGQVVDHERRIEALEAQLSSPDRLISAEQAMRISQAVKAIAHELGQRSGRNEYAGVYGELYRRYGVPSYRELPAAKFDDAMLWLSGWYQELTDSADVPF